MTSFYMTLRGLEDVEIEIDRDYGYEWDTGAHDIEWHVADDRFKGIELTDDEEQMIYERCVEVGREVEMTDYCDLRD